MKKINKIAALVTAFTLTAAAAALAGCGDEHTHIWGGYESDANGHWRVCTEDGERSETESHVYDGDGDAECNVCGYKRTTGGETGNPGDGADDVVDATRTVSKIEVKTNPTRTEYEAGDTFSAEGGVILVTYTDGSTQELPMTSPSFTLSSPGMSATGTKTVTVKCGNKSTRFTIKVSTKSYTIVFNDNYDGAPAPTEEKVIQGAAVESKQSVREGYTLEGWYTDADFTQKYVFASESEGGVQADATLYALWKKDGAQYVNVTIDYDYYGVKLDNYS